MNIDASGRLVNALNSLFETCKKRKQKLEKKSRRND